MSESPPPAAASELPPLRPWLTWAMAALFVLGLLYWWGGAWAIREARSVAAVHYAQKTQEKLRQKDWAGAQQELARARSWLVTNPQVLRAYADLLIATRQDDLSLLQVLRGLDAMQQATPQDRLRTAQILISLGRVAEAQAEYDRLPEAQKQTSDSLELLAGLYQAQGRKDEAEKLMRQVLAMSADDPKSRLRLAVMNHQEAFPEMQARGRRELWEIARGQDEDTAVRAMEFLAARAELTGEEAGDLLRLIDEHSSAPPALRYTALSARLRARPQDRAMMVEKEVERVRGMGKDALTPALAWLLQQNEPGKVIELLPGDLHLKSGPLLQAYLTALSLLDRWADIDTLVKTQRALPVSAIFLHLWKARAAEKLNAGIRTVRHHLEAAFAETGRGQDEAAAKMTAEIAEQMNQWDLAWRFYDDIATAQPLSRTAMLEKVHQMALRGRDTDAALAAARKLAELHPENQIFTQHALYLALLAGQDLETTERTLAGAAMKTGGSTAALVRALAAYRLGDLKQVAASLAALEDVADLSAGQKAVHAGLRAVCGETGPAFRLAEGIPAILLLPEELRFLKRAL